MRVGVAGSAVRLTPVPSVRSKRSYRRCCGLRRKQAAPAGGGSGDRRLQGKSADLHDGI